MSVRGIGRYWRSIEPGWKLLGALGVIVTFMFTSISYAVDLHAKADRVPELERQVTSLRNDVIEIKNDVKWLVKERGGK